MSKPSRIKPAPAAEVLPSDDGPSAADAAAQARAERALAKRAKAASTGLAALVESLRADMAGAAASAETSLAALARVLLPGTGTPGHAPVDADREAALAALNAVLGDQLARNASPLSIRMALRHAGRALALQRAVLATRLPRAGGRLLVTIHDFGMSDLQWRRHAAHACPVSFAVSPPTSHDHGQALSDTLGFTTLALHYNSGLHVSTNGRALALQLEQLLHEWPMPLARFAILAHGMGGLLARSALQHGRAAGHHWPDRLDDLVFLGTPHHGTDLVPSPASCWLGETPHGAAFATLAGLSSPGLTDLCHGNLLDEDWLNGDRLARATDRRVAVPLPIGPRCHAIAGSVFGAGGAPGASSAEGADGASRGAKAPASGDGFVPLASALGRHRLARRTLKFPPARLHTFARTDHLGLLANPEVFAQLQRCLAE